MPINWDSDDSFERFESDHPGNTLPSVSEPSPKLTVEGEKTNPEISDPNSTGASVSKDDPILRPQYTKDPRIKSVLSPPKDSVPPDNMAESQTTDIGQSDLMQVKKDILGAMTRQFQAITNRVDDLHSKMDSINSSMENRIDKRIEYHIDEMFVPLVNHMVQGELAPRDLEANDLRNEVASLRRELRELKDNQTAGLQKQIRNEIKATNEEFVKNYQAEREAMKRDI